MIQVDLSKSKIRFLFFVIVFSILFSGFQNCSKGFNSISDSENSSLNNSVETITNPADIPIDLKGDLALYARSTQVVQGEDIKILVRLNKPHSNPVTVSAKVEGDTAIEGQDFIPWAGAITIPAGSTVAEIKILGLIPSAYTEDKKFNFKIITADFGQSSESEIGKIAQQVSQGFIKARLEVAKNKSMFFPGETNCRLSDKNIYQCQGSIYDGFNSIYSDSFVDIVSLPPVLSIAGNCALTTDRRVVCWGRNNGGQAGVDPQISTFLKSPAEVSGLSGVDSIFGNDQTKCAVMQNKTVRCWGHNNSILLGQPATLAYSHLPVDMGLTNIKSIKIYNSSYAKACALSFSGAIQCWGKITDTNTISAPKLVYQNIDVSDFVYSGQIRYGAPGKLCVLLFNGKVVCSTKDSDPLGDSPQFEQISDIENVVSLGMGYFSGQTCALTSQNDVYCWGNNIFGALGFLSLPNQAFNTPQKVPSWTGAVSLKVDSYYTCATFSDGSVSCTNYLKDNKYSKIALDIPSISDVIDARTYPYGIDCALLKSGGSKCWKPITSGDDFSNGSHILFNNEYLIKPVVYSVSNLDHLAIGYSSSGKDWPGCFVNRDNGKVQCWGNNQFGQLGNNSKIDSATPVDVLGIESNPLKIYTYSGDFYCAITKDRTLKCWGRFPYSVASSITDRSQATSIDGLSNLESMQIDYLYTLFTMTDGSVIKYNHSGSPKIENNFMATTGSCSILNDLTVKCGSVLVEGVANAKFIKNVYSDSYCAIGNLGQLSCWDFKTSGSGSGTVVKKNIPSLGFVNGFISAGLIYNYQNICVSVFENNTDVYKCWNSSSGEVNEIPELRGFQYSKNSDGIYFDKNGRVRSTSPVRMTNGPHILSFTTNK